MKKYFLQLHKVGLTCLVLLSSTACFGSALPKTPPSDLVIEYSEDGGMRYWSEELKLTTTTCHYAINDGGKKQEWDCPASSGALGDIYKILRDNDFDRIKLASGVIYDKPGEHVTVRYSSENFNLGTSGADVQLLWRKSWDTIVVGFRALIEKIQAEHTSASVGL